MCQILIRSDNSIEYQNWKLPFFNGSIFFWRYLKENKLFYLCNLFESYRNVNRKSSASINTNVFFWRSAEPLVNGIFFFIQNKKNQYLLENVKIAQYSHCKKFLRGFPLKFRDANFCNFFRVFSNICKEKFPKLPTF